MKRDCLKATFSSSLEQWHEMPHLLHFTEYVVSAECKIGKTKTTVIRNVGHAYVQILTIDRFKVVIQAEQCQIENFIGHRRHTLSYDLAWKIILALVFMADCSGWHWFLSSLDSTAFSSQSSTDSASVNCWKVVDDTDCLRDLSWCRELKHGITIHMIGVIMLRSELKMTLSCKLWMTEWWGHYKYKKGRMENYN